MLCVGLFALTACDLFGKEGVGIEKIEKTDTQGLVDTYTITLTNGETSTFTVTNGKNGTDGENANGATTDPSDPTPDSYLRFTLLEDDSYEVCARINDMPARIEIPSSYNGKPVTRIADGGFRPSGQSYDYYPLSPIEEIVLPDTITSIGKRAFENQRGLRSINIPSSVTEIGEFAFLNCDSLSFN